MGILDAIFNRSLIKEAPSLAPISSTPISNPGSNLSITAIEKQLNVPFDAPLDVPRVFKVAVGSLQGGMMNESFISFTGDSWDPSKRDGWKFHISVSPEDRNKAFEIVSQEAQKYRIGGFKVATSEYADVFADPANAQRGKMFTIPHSGEEGFKDFLQAVENRMHMADIKPSHAVDGDRALGGSRYFSYRNDGHFNGGEHIPADKLKDLPESMRYNPNGLPDQFKDFDISKKRPLNPRYPQDNMAQVIQLSPEEIKVVLKREAANIESYLGSKLGDNNILSVNMNEEGTYKVEVPRNFSRNNLKDVVNGDPESFVREFVSEKSAVITIPRESITMRMSLDGQNIRRELEQKTATPEPGKRAIGEAIEGGSGIKGFFKKALKAFPGVAVVVVAPEVFAKTPEIADSKENPSTKITAIAHNTARLISDSLAGIVGGAALQEGMEKVAVKIGGEGVKPLLVPLDREGLEINNKPDVMKLKQDADNYRATFGKPKEIMSDVKFAKAMQEAKDKGLTDKDYKPVESDQNMKSVVIAQKAPQVSSDKSMLIN